VQQSTAKKQSSSVKSTVQTTADDESDQISTSNSLGAVKQGKPDFHPQP